MGLAMARQLLQAGDTLLTLSRQTSDELAQAAKAADTELLQWQQDLADAEAASIRLTQWLAEQPPSRFARATLINNATKSTVVITATRSSFRSSIRCAPVFACCGSLPH